jgi:phage shock protein C
VKRTFRLDRRNGKILGVCAGFANMTGWDPTLIRVGAVVVTILGAFPWTLIAYGVAALVAKKGPVGLAEHDQIRAPRMSARDLAESTRDIDRRLVEVDSYVANSNRRLADEIDSLR